MIRKNIAAALTAYWELVKKHPFINIALSLALIAACAGAIYLLLLQVPALTQLPCFRGGCSN